jgi:hypothetical protein
VVIHKSGENTVLYVGTQQDYSTHVREIWTQFRLRDRPIWRAFDLKLMCDKSRQTTFHYPSNFDESLGFERRARRWAAANYGRAGLIALLERD